MNTTPTQQPAPDHGEPWQLTTDFAFDITIREELAASFNKIEHANRAASCVNACAGMADPAKEIQAMRTAITEVHATLQALHNAPWLTIPGRAGDEIENLLANLQPFLKS